MKKFLISLFILALAPNIQAQEASNQQKQEAFGNWYSVITKEKNQKLCYIYGKPQKQEGKLKGQLNPKLFINFIKNKDWQFSISSGYEYKNDSIHITIDENKFRLFTDKTFAWAYDSQQDLKIIDAMKQGKTLKAHGVSKKNNNSIETYDLRNFTKAVNYIKANCNK